MQKPVKSEAPVTVSRDMIEELLERVEQLSAKQRNRPVKPFDAKLPYEVSEEFTRLVAQYKSTLPKEKQSAQTKTAWVTAALQLLVLPELRKLVREAHDKDGLFDRVA